MAYFHSSSGQGGYVTALLWNSLYRWRFIRKRDGKESRATCMAEGAGADQWKKRRREELVFFNFRAVEKVSGEDRHSPAIGAITRRTPVNCRDRVLTTRQCPPAASYLRH